MHGVLFRFKTNLPLLPLPFSSSDPRSLFFSIQTEKKYTKSPPCGRASDSVAPKTLSAKALIIKNGCHPNMYVYALFSIPTIDVITSPSTAAASSLLGTTPHYYPLQSPYSSHTPTGLSTALPHVSPPFASNVHNPTIVNSTHQQHPFD